MYSRPFLGAGKCSFIRSRTEDPLLPSLFTEETSPLGSHVFSVWIRVLLFWGPIKTPAESERTVFCKSNIDFNTVCYARVNCETFLLGKNIRLHFKSGNE